MTYAPYLPNRAPGPITTVNELTEIVAANLRPLLDRIEVPNGSHRVYPGIDLVVTDGRIVITLRG